MSKTFRRKTGRPRPHWVTEKWTHTGSKTNGYDYAYIPLKGPELGRSIAKYHGDSSKGYGWNGNAPKDFCKMIDRAKRAKEKAETRKMLVTGDYENYSYAPRKKDAGWQYW